jgi:hypothetical protein
MTFLMLLYFMFRMAMGDGSPTVATEAYFTTDDGKTWFADDVKKVPPFDKDGKQAVRAYVYRCAGGEPFISHLERYTPEGKKALEQAMKQNDPNNPALMEEVILNGVQVKKPGSDAVKGWVKMSNLDMAGRIMELKCPDGKLVGLEPVIP